MAAQIKPFNLEEIEELVRLANKTDYVSFEDDCE